MASSMVTTILPLYVVYILNDGVDKLGIIIAVATFISYFFRIVFGYLSDKYQVVKPFVVSGYVVSIIIGQIWDKIGEKQAEIIFTGALLHCTSGVFYHCV